MTARQNAIIQRPGPLLAQRLGNQRLQNMKKDSIKENVSHTHMERIQAKLYVIHIGLNSILQIRSIPVNHDWIS